MELISVHDPRFSLFGQVLEGYDFSEAIETLTDKTPCPMGGTVYVASEPELEKLTITSELTDRGFGGIPIQFGYCNGENYALTALEYHRGSEIDIAGTDMILLLGLQTELVDHTLDTNQIRAFFLPKGTAVELFATTLHYAPCSAKKGLGFLMGCVLPRGTNTDMPPIEKKSAEDSLLFAANKWLIAASGTSEADSGAFVGLFGEMIDLIKDGTVTE